MIANCKKCPKRNTCIQVCNAARDREKRMKEDFEKRNRLVKKSVLLAMDKNNGSFREGL